MEEEVVNLSNLFYLAIEAECEICHRRFTEPEGDNEHSIGEWARRRAAAAAYHIGWRDVGGRPLCPDCVAKISN